MELTCISGQKTTHLAKFFEKVFDIPLLRISYGAEHVINMFVLAFDLNSNVLATNKAFFFSMKQSAKSLQFSK